MKKQAYKISEEVLQYQIAYDRLDIDAVFSLIDFEPHEGQQKIIDKVQSRHISFTTIACGRRTGKSLVVAGIAVSRLLLPNAKIVLMSKTFSNASNLYKEVFKFIKRVNIKMKSTNKTNLSFELENGSTFTSISERNVDSVLGSAISTIIVDEAAVMNQESLENAIEQLLSPALASYGVREDGTQYGEIILLSSPRKARGYFYNQFKKGRRGIEGYASVQLPTSVNPYIPRIFLKRKEKELPPAIFNTEYLGLFDDSSGDNVFYAFKYDKCTFNKDKVHLQLVAESTVVIGLDYGYSDSSSQVYVYVEPLTGKYYVLSEYMKNKLGLGEHVVQFKKNEDKYPCKRKLRYADPSAALVTATMASSFNYFAQPGLNNIRESIDCINTLFHQGKLVIDEECFLLIDTVEQLEWKETEGSKDPFKPLPKYLGHGDLVASLRYAIYTHWKMYVENSYEIISI